MTEIASVSGRTFVVGDIHGCDTALEMLLERFQLRSDDTLVVLGDAIDRGPNSRQVLECLCAVQRDCQLVYLLGNHEEMLHDVLTGVRPHFWLDHGGAATLASYGGSIQRIPDPHLELLSRTVPYWQSSSVICVHANLEPGVELQNQRPVYLRWQSLTGHEFPHPSGKLVVCGHTGQPSGLPMIRDGWACLDTLAYTGRYLTGMDVCSMKIYQAKQSGEFREFEANVLNP